MFEGFTAARLPGRVPATGGLVAHAAAPGNLGFGAPLREELNRLHAPLFQRGEVSFNTFWITHIVLDSDRVKWFTILCKCQ
jgi:hypothetical protein